MDEPISQKLISIAKDDALAKIVRSKAGINSTEADGGSLL
jgi:hypothetical protein